MGGYIGSKAVALSTTGADINGDANVDGSLTVGGAFTSLGIDDNATSTAITIDESENVGLGSVPSAWGPSYTAQQVKNSSIYAAGDDLVIASNTYVDGSDVSRYIDAYAYPSKYTMYNGMHIWSVSDSTQGAGNVITWDDAARIDRSSNFLLGTASNPVNARFVADAGANSVATSFYSANATYGVVSTWNYGGTRVGEIGSLGSIEGGASLTDFAINAPFNLSLTTGYTARLRIDSVGRVTKPYQPAFYATGTNGNVAYTSGQTFPFNTGHYNVGNHYNSSNGFFTAPVSGVYSFSYNVFATTGLFQATVKINGTDWVVGTADTQGIADVANAEGSRTGGNTLLIPLSAGDYVHIGMRNGFSGTVYMGHSHFCGYLLG
jgi:hypothetical protein